MSSKHTSGEWYIDERAKTRVRTKARGICSAGSYFTTERDVTEENEANARLIASAPKMYELINQFLNSYCYGDATQVDSFRSDAEKLIEQIDNPKG